MSNALITANRQLWLNIRNYLYPMTYPEVRVERNLADDAGDDVRRDLIDLYIDREFCIVCNDNAGSININQYGECPDCADYDDEDYFDLCED